MLERWDPFRDLKSTQNEMNRSFGRTYGSGELGTGATGSLVPPLDVYKGVLTIEVPKREEAKPREIRVKAKG